MTEMSEKEIKKFFMEGTFTAKLATVKKDGSPHVVPIWFVLEGMIMQQHMAKEIVLKAQFSYA
jgi:nitroimidazol reductase NimA-like FMN-containing flavoprotein (pyridoxamine 5'-phosphate oxidase superfamily)